jgi:hypothetical protein
VRPWRFHISLRPNPRMSRDIRFWPNYSLTELWIKNGIIGSIVRIKKQCSCKKKMFIMNWHWYSSSLKIEILHLDEPMLNKLPRRPPRFRKTPSKVEPTFNMSWAPENEDNRNVIVIIQGSLCLRVLSFLFHKNFLFLVSCYRFKKNSFVIYTNCLLLSLLCW